MTENQWESKIRRLSRRLERVRAASRGDAKITRTWVKPGWVKRHRRSGYHRLTITVAARDRRR